MRHGREPLGPRIEETIDLDCRLQGNALVQASASTLAICHSLSGRPQHVEDLGSDGAFYFQINSTYFCTTKIDTVTVLLVVFLVLGSSVPSVTVISFVPGFTVNADGICGFRVSLL
jgi:hypothetical protein